MHMMAACMQRHGQLQVFACYRYEFYVSNYENVLHEVVKVFNNLENTLQNVTVAHPSLAAQQPTGTLGCCSLLCMARSNPGCPLSHKDQVANALAALPENPLQRAGYEDTGNVWQLLSSQQGRAPPHIG